MKISIGEFKKQLKGDEENLRRDFYRFPQSTNSIIRGAVQGNTLRSYGRGLMYNRYKPSSIFRVWAQDFLSELLKEKRMRSYKDFKRFHNKAVEGLEKHWKKLEPKANGLQFFRFAKLIDLMFKTLPNWKELTMVQRNFFFQNAHVPLDKYSLSALIRFVDRKEYGLPYNPSMNSVKSEDHYWQLQKVIKNLVAPKPAILFDLYAYNYSRFEVENPEKFHLEKAK